MYVKESAMDIEENNIFTIVTPNMTKTKNL